ncbi:MAG: ferritin family protein [Ignavibacteria bacterium]|nr:ferritin family protein [Ignavibacteria bacterium]
MGNFNPQNLVELALKVEEKGAKVYNQLAEKFASNSEISETFRLLARDEQIHYNQFLALKKEIPETLDNISKTSEEFFNYIDLERYFLLFDSVSELDKILKYAYDFERDTYIFYTAIRDAVGKFEVLDSIIEFEKSHMIKLLQYILTESKFRGIADKF